MGLDTVLIAALVGLALVDSTSIGTLVIPIWLLLAPGRLPVRRLAVYLGTITAFYFALGVALAFGARSGLRLAGELASNDVVRWVQLVAGVALFVVSFRFDSQKRRAAGEENRVARWRRRALAELGSGKKLAVLALAAGALEAVTMLPYLAAIGLIVANGLPAAQFVPLLALYCLVMVVPAVVLVVLRRVGGARLDSLLGKVDGFLSRNSDSAMGWVLGIAGFLLARDAAAALYLAG